MSAVTQDDEVRLRIAVEKDVMAMNFDGLKNFVLSGVKVNLFSDDGKLRFFETRSILKLYKGDTLCIRLICRLASDLVFLAEYLLKDGDHVNIDNWWPSVVENLQPNATRIFNAYVKVLLGPGIYNYETINTTLMTCGYLPLPFSTNPELENINLDEDELIFIVMDIMAETTSSELFEELLRHGLCEESSSGSRVFEEFKDGARRSL